MANVRTMEQVVSEAMAADRFHSVLFAAFAAVALVLAALGIYGVMSFVVAQRTHEIGLRMALGAGRRRVLVDVLRDGLTTSLVGVAIGAIGAVVVSRLMVGMVTGANSADPLAFAVVAADAAGRGRRRVPGARPPRGFSGSDGSAATGLESCAHGEAD